VTDAELADVVARLAAAVLGFTGAPPERVTLAAEASVALVRGYLYGDPDPDLALAPVPDGAESIQGLVALCVRIYHDPASPGGVVGGDAYTGAAIPEDLLAHVHHYFDRYRRAWGIA
jgi:hypothetical protein